MSDLVNYSFDGEAHRGVCFCLRFAPRTRSLCSGMGDERTRTSAWFFTPTETQNQTRGGREHGGVWESYQLTTPGRVFM